MAPSRAEIDILHLEDTLLRFRDYVQIQESKEVPAAPFVNMKSTSGDRRFRLFILEEKDVEPVEGDFSCYGLSTNATVAVF